MSPVPPVNDAGRALIQRLEPHLPKLAEFAEIHDRDASFPFASFQMLRDIGWMAAPIPREYGGEECSLADLVAAQTALARVDMALAFACGMHLMSVGSERSNRSWPEQLRERIFRSVVDDGALCNQVASEPELGSPQGGGRPQTALTPDGPGRWRINGRKSFTTLAPDLTWFLTYCAVEDGSGKLARVAVHRDSPGLRIEETWDVVGLRATGSHDVWFENVLITDDEFLVRQDPAQAGQRHGDFAWFALLVSAASLGVAEAARDYTVDFARHRRPGGAPGVIGSLPTVRAQVGEIDLRIMSARALLHETASAWDQLDAETRFKLGPRVAATKLHTGDTAVDVVDRCMRLVGGISLHRSQPLERYYRDVRGPLHNPPITPRGLEVIAAAALDPLPDVTS
ncbi:MAG: acyl-CoA/acyl-ACP dehydrogenase [Chloroflexota bacterium]|nr:acyl-CoA/acyl-ACP dehydrogenase [Chloroflexota bacterium]MDE2893818.1 acyl-CoA/acyl-ACP dehydrogenase [Chloroflexota bacterium]